MVPNTWTSGTILTWGMRLALPALVTAQPERTVHADLRLVPVVITALMRRWCVHMLMSGSRLMMHCGEGVAPYVSATTTWWADGCWGRCRCWIVGRCIFRSIIIAEYPPPVDISSLCIVLQICLVNDFAVLCGFLPAPGEKRPKRGLLFLLLRWRWLLSHRWNWSRWQGCRAFVRLRFVEHLRIFWRWKCARLLHSGFFSMREQCGAGAHGFVEACSFLLRNRVRGGGWLGGPSVVVAYAPAATPPKEL